MSFVVQQKSAPAEASSYALLLEFGFLQILDILTTLTCFAHGAVEANPVVSFLITTTGDPITGLVTVKIIATMMGVFCHASGRVRLLRRGNLFFWIIVVWTSIAAILCLPG
jgi:hypothetical protein